MTDETWQDAEKTPSGQEVAVDYIKADGFRSIWVDGAIGGLTPRGIIHCALYAERVAIPRRQVYSIVMNDDTSGTLGPEVLEKQISRGSIVREMTCDMFISIEGAENLANWLLQRGKEAKTVLKDQK